MPRPNKNRTLGNERTLARRLAFEREENGWTYEGLAKRMEAVGCPIQPSALYKIEKADPPRRVTLDEFVALSNVLDVPMEELLLPVAMVRERRAREIAKEIPLAFGQYDDAVMNGLRLYLEYGRLAQGSPELLEYMNNHADPVWDREVARERTGVDLGDGATAEDVAELQRSVTELWGRVLRLASKAAAHGSAD